MQGLFIGVPEADLLAMREKAIEALKTGKVTTSFNAPGLSATSDVILSPKESLLEIRYALQRIDPDTYGRSLITKRTRPTFY